MQNCREKQESSRAEEQHVCEAYVVLREPDYESTTLAGISFAVQ